MASALTLAGCARDLGPQDHPPDSGTATIDTGGILRPDVGTPDVGVDAGRTLDPCTRPGLPCSLPVGQFTQAHSAELACVGWEGEGVCHSRCERSGDPKECGADQWCLDAGDGEPLPVCFPDECAQERDCGSHGTCLRFRRDVGLCFYAGTAPVGAPCDDSGQPERECGADLVCDDYHGVCRRLCDPWGTAVCGPGTTCGLYTSWTGACWPRTFTGQEPFETCTPEGEYCGHNLLCVQIDPPPAGANCVPLCLRDDPDSCAQYRPFDLPTRCVEAFDDPNGDADEVVGLCLP